jgi:hypothetical protein
VCAGRATAGTVLFSVFMRRLLVNFSSMTPSGSPLGRSRLPLIRILCAASILPQAPPPATSPSAGPRVAFSDAPKRFVPAVLHSSRRCWSLIRGPEILLQPHLCLVLHSNQNILSLPLDVLELFEPDAFVQPWQVRHLLASAEASVSSFALVFAADSPHAGGDGGR